ncbi:MAG: hypothetical protein H7839_24775 [Magnetococcus sp. YQC-5]
MDDTTLLLRQIHPCFFQNGQVSSQAFRPTPKDENRLSVYDGDQITPQQAWEHFTRMPRCTSIGVMGVTVAECAALLLPTHPDPAPFPEHAIIDFSACTKSQVEKKAKQLRMQATARDWLYRATPSSSPSD